MRLFPEPLSFEWDEGNSRKNPLRHRVSNQEAEEVFFNQPNFILEDEAHSSAERRFGLLAETKAGRRLSVVFTVRRDKIRVISARDMSRKERKTYEKIKEAAQIQKRGPGEGLLGNP